MTNDASTPTPDVPGDGIDGSTSPAPASTGREVFRKALREVTILLCGLAVVSVVVGAIVAQMAGVWGALLGVALAAIFSGTTVWTMYRTADSNPTTMAAVVMGGWLAKMVVVVGALALLRDLDFYDRWVFAATLLVGAIGSALVDYRAVTTSRLPYVEPRSQ